MKIIKWFFIVVFSGIAILVAWFSIGNWMYAFPIKQKMALLKEDLHVGDSRERAVQIISRHRLPCRWKEDNSSYECPMRRDGKLSPFVITIIIDKEDKVEKLFLYDETPRL